MCLLMGNKKIYKDSHYSRAILANLFHSFCQNGMFPYFIIITLISFFGSQQLIKLPVCPFAFTSCLIIPAAVLLFKTMQIEPRAVITIFLLLQFNDAFSYLFGKKLGKTKLFPNLSPNKTLEGYLFGGLG